MKEKDINVKIYDYILNCRAVAIIIKNNKILFQKRKQDKFWALPGGKIRIDETGEEAIKRELNEELGIENSCIKRVHSISEYFFTFNKNKYHQYIFAYIVETNKNNNNLLENKEFKGIEKTENLLFKWFDIDLLYDAPIKPDFLKQNLKEINNKEIIFNTYIEK